MVNCAGLFAYKNICQLTVELEGTLRELTNDMEVEFLAANGFLWYFGGGRGLQFRLMDICWDLRIRFWRQVDRDYYF